MRGAGREVSAIFTKGSEGYTLSREEYALCTF